MYRQIDLNRTKSLSSIVDFLKKVFERIGVRGEGKTFFKKFSFPRNINFKYFFFSNILVWVYLRNSISV